MSLVRVPAIGCELFAPNAELDETLIREQVRVSLVRMGDRFSLDDVRRRFFQRKFEYRLLQFEFPVRLENVGADPKDPKAVRASFRKKTVTLRAVASNLMQAQLSPVFGRDQPARELAEYMTGQTPQSVLMVGPAGVGKTAIVHQLVHMMQASGEPSLPQLADRIVWSTTGSRLVSGMSGARHVARALFKADSRSACDASHRACLARSLELMEAGKIEGQPGVASHDPTSGRSRAFADYC